MIEINSSDENVIDEAVKTLSNGGLIIFPTETCYGAGVDATNIHAVTKLLEYKKRPVGKAISIACTGEAMANEYVEVNESARKIYKEFLPGPVTVISKSKGSVDKRLESETGGLGVRVPNHELLLKIIEKFGKPITSTSANLSGEKTPYSTEDIFENISEKRLKLVDLVINAGELPKNLPSTVIDTTSLDLQIYRQGQVSFKNKEPKRKILSKSVEQTMDIAEEMTRELDQRPLLILLHGELGAGKTHFTKGIARALGISDTVKSPSYTYVEEYKIDDGSKLYHIDAWKISNKEDLDILGFESWIKSRNVIVIEWPEVIENLGFKINGIDAKVVELELLDKGENEREIIEY